MLLFVYFLIFLFFVCFFFFFFFQAEDGIRDADVTGVQTCALPIFADRRADGLGRDPVLDVVRRLGLTPPLGLADGRGHRPGHAVSVHDDLAVDVARGPAGGLDQRRRGAEVAFL